MLRSIFDPVPWGMDAGPSQLLNRRNSRLRRLMVHAYEGVPYYRQLFDRVGINPRDVRTGSDLSVVPVSSKPDLQEAGEGAVDRRANSNRLIVRKTTGSTGRPFTIRRTWFEERTLGVYRRQVLSAYGQRPTDLQTDVLELEPTDPNDGQGLYRTFCRLGLFRQARISALDDGEDIARRLLQQQPQVITGYAGSLARAAEALLRMGERPASTRFVAAHSEVLTPHMRRRIAEAFAAPVRTLYDCNECNLIAWECPQSGEMHVRDDSVIVEVLKENGQPAKEGEEGEVVITSLHSLAMPLIRFRIGDVATRGVAQCACGSPFSSLRSVLGRMVDYFPLPDGRKLHPYWILALLGDKESWIRHYQLLQEKTDRIVLRVVPTSAGAHGPAQTVRSRVAELLGPGVKFKIEFCDDLELDGTAKLRICRSLVSSTYGGAKSELGSASESPVPDQSKACIG